MTSLHPALLRQYASKLWEYRLHAHTCLWTVTAMNVPEVYTSCVYMSTCSVHVINLVGKQRPLSCALPPETIDGWLEPKLPLDPGGCLHYISMAHLRTTQDTLGAGHSMLRTDTIQKPQQWRIPSFLGKMC